MAEYSTVSALLSRARKNASREELAAGALWSVAGGSMLVLVAVALARWLGPNAVRPPLLAALSVGILAALWWFVVRPRRALRSERVVALRLAAAAPHARSDLLTAVELQQAMSLESAALQYSPQLARAAIERAAERTSALDPRLAADRRGLARAALALGGAAVLHLLALGVVPGMSSAYAALFADVSRGGPLPSAVPIAGDIELTYRYPAYTGLPSKTVAGTGGEITALLGTEVRIVARADRDVERAFTVTEQGASPMDVVGRKLTGKLLVSAPGSWRLRYAKKNGDVAAEGPTVPISIEPDLAPEIGIDAPLTELEVNPDSRVRLDWHAGDDFGLGEIALVWRPDGAIRDVRKVIGAGRDREKTLRGDYTWDMSELGLRPGDRVRYYLEALDKDTVSGPKRGVSRTQTLKVFSPAEHNRIALQKAEALWERLVGQLGARLEPRAAELLGGGRPADEAAIDLVGDMRSTASEIYKDKAAPREIAAALLQVANGVERVTRRTTSARRGGGQQLARALDADVAEVEKDVLYLEDLVDRRKIEDLVELGREMRNAQRDLVKALEKFREAPDDASRRAVEREIARLKERINELLQRMAELSRGIRDEHLNAEALAEMAEMENVGGLLDDVQRYLAEGKIDDALKLLDEMGRQLDEMVQQMDQRRGDFGGEEYAELRKQMREAMDELEAVTREEEQIARDTEKVREQTRQAMEEKLKAAGKEFVQKQKERLQKARQRLQDVDQEVVVGRMFDEELARAEQRLEDASQALDMGDFDEARNQAAEGLRSINQVAGQLQLEAEWLGRLQQVGPERAQNVQKSAKAADSARPPVQDVIADLDKMMPKPGEALSQEQRAELDRLSQRQRQNQGRTDRLRQSMEEIAQQAPLGSGPMEELGQASQSMGGASRKMRDGDPRGASQDAKNALEKLAGLQQQMRQRGQGQGQGMPMPFPLAWGEGERDGEGRDMSKEKVEIPRPEQFQTPEEFRRELMEAMKQATPEPYKERVKDYYQELVK